MWKIGQLDSQLQRIDKKEDNTLLVHVILEVTSITTSTFQILITDLRPAGHKRNHTAVVAVGNLQ